MSLHMAIRGQPVYRFGRSLDADRIFIGATWLRLRPMSAQPRPVTVHHCLTWRLHTSSQCHY